MPPTSQIERRLVWHPRKENKFIVGGGSQITLYKWEPNDLGIRHVTSQTDFQYMKCFAWSPDATLDDLVAVGHTTGRVDLVRLEAAKSARQGGVLSSGPVASLIVRTARPCNALAFSSAEPRCLAVGLDKVRSDPSLTIWDINNAVRMLSITPPRLQSDTVVQPLPMARQTKTSRTEAASSRPESRILHQHAPAESVSALSFVPNTAHLLLAGLSYRWLRLFDLRSQVPSTMNVASKVQGIVTDPFDPHRIGCFGDGTITVWDVRRLLQPLLSFTERDAAGDGARPSSTANYTAVEFSHDRRGMIASMERDASHVRFWNTLETQPLKVDTSEAPKPREPVAKRWTPWSTTPIVQARQPSPRPLETNTTLILADTQRTKAVSKPLASFTLVPSPHAHPATSNIIIATKDGDLSIHSVNDGPKQCVWSAQGDLTIGARLSFHILHGKDGVPVPDSSDIPSLQTQPSSERLIKQDMRKDPNAPLFGRGDEDGFPALTSPQVAPASNLTSTRPRQSRSQSPAIVSNGLVNGDTRQNIERVDASTKDTASAGNEESKVQAVNKRRRKGIGLVLQDDISMLIRKRAIQGYSLHNLAQNAFIVKDRTSMGRSDPTTYSLVQTWTWLNHSREYLCDPTPKLHGYNFAFEGVLGIWEGFAPTETYVPPPPATGTLGAAPKTSHYRRGSRSLSPDKPYLPDFQSALSSLISRKNVEKSSWRPSFSTQKLVHRQVALQLCGWSGREENFKADVARWRKEGQYSRAACWLVFARRVNEAVDVLMNSEDELHQMMSGTLAALAASGSSHSLKHDLRNNCERLIFRLNDPYFRAMLTHLVSGEWSEVLDEELLPLRERLCIAFQFLDDKALLSYLRRCKSQASDEGNIDGLMVTGLTKQGLDIIQGYVDRTGDVQTAAILSSYVYPWKVSDSRAERWIDAYRDLFDNFKLHHYRVAFDVERGELLNTVLHPEVASEALHATGQVLIRCNYCNKTVAGPGVVPVASGLPTSCPHCQRGLPRCSVCLMTLSIMQSSIADIDLSNPPPTNPVEDAIVICQSCRHGGHLSHILDWFFGSQSHGVCAVADCDCRCADEF